MEKSTYAEMIASLEPGCDRQAQIDAWYDAMGLRRGCYCPESASEKEPVVESEPLVASDATEGVPDSEDPAAESEETG